MRDLLTIRKKLGLSQKELGSIISVSPTQVCRIEAGTRELSLAQFGLLCKALKLTNEIQQEMIDEAISSARPPRIRKSKARD